MMTEYDEKAEIREAQINALLDGELGEEEVKALRQAAESDPVLAQAIIDAHALQAGLDELEIERAPDSLRRRLAEIPGTHKGWSRPGKARRWFGMPRWVPAGALAAVPVLVIAMVMMQPGGVITPDEPEYTEAEILKARQEVALAFAYLDRIGQRTGRQIESELAEELGSEITKNISRYMPYTHHSEQEESS